TTQGSPIAIASTTTFGNASLTDERQKISIAERKKGTSDCSPTSRKFFVIPPSPIHPRSAGLDQSMLFPTIKNLTLPRLAAKLDAAATKLRKSFNGSKRPTEPMTISSAPIPNSARALTLEFECRSKTEKSYPLGITVILCAAYPSLICASLAD